MCFNKTLCIVLFFSVMSQLKADPVYHEKQQQAAALIQSIYHHQLDDKLPSMADRLEYISGLLMDKPYWLGALGEGASGRYDQYPLYRLDAFDCLTFVETVLALSFGHDLSSFQHLMNTIRYQDGHISFLHRNHFTDLDWNTHNQKNGFLKDITMTIHNQHQHPIAKMASAVINKPDWYQHMSASRIRLIDSLVHEQTQRLQELKRRGQSLFVQKAKIPYIPLTAIVDASGKVNQEILEQIPSGAIIEIVRPNWDLRKSIGTSLNVSHLGFAFWKDGILMFRNASTLKGRVVDQPLVGYLQDALKSPTIKGINIQIVLQPRLRD